MAVRTKHEAGIVSIMVTMILMIVITLIVLGFAEISRAEQRNSLDAQLSAQAYYAAESGVNDARSAIIAMMAGGATTIPNKTACGTDPNYPTLSPPNNTIDTNHGVSYTCVLIDTTLPVLTYQISHTPTVIPLISGTGAAFGQLKLTWTPGAGLSNSTANCTVASGQYPPANLWNCNYPALRIDLVHTDGVLTRASWTTRTETIFLTPSVSGVSSFNFGAGGLERAITCNSGSGTCTVTINGLGADRSMYMRVSTLYRDNSQLTISTTAGKTFSGAQAKIDATGQAQDVLRRVLVAIDLSNSSMSPVAAITSQDSVCKRFEVTNNWFAVPLDSNLNNPTGADNNTLCQQQQTGGSPQP